MTALDERPAAHGPYASLDAAATDAGHIYAAVRQLGDLGILPRILEGLEIAALREAHVLIGAGDRQFAAYFASWEPEFVQIVIGWVERAYAAGQDSILAPVQSMLDDPAAVVRDVALIRCCVHGCTQTELLPVGSTLMCPEHGGESHEIKRGIGS